MTLYDPGIELFRFFTLISLTMSANLVCAFLDVYYTYLHVLELLGRYRTALFIHDVGYEAYRIESRIAIELLE